MEKTMQMPARRFSRGWEYLVLLPLAFILVISTVKFYTDVSLGRGQMEFAVFITVCFMLGLFVGRYFAQLVAPRNFRYTNILLIFLCALIVAIIIWLLVFAEKSLDKQSVYLKLLFLGLPFILLSIVLGMVIKISRNALKTRFQDVSIAAEQSHSELKLLQSQLSPHFLFNTLNNIYGISLTQHEKVPPLLLRLSSLLRYSVYDTRELFVPLSSELAYINDYIEFERLRIGERLALTTAFEKIDSPDLKIAPMLLIVFVENAFKHAKNSTDHRIYIDIIIRTWGNSILFSIKNTCSSVTEESSIVNQNSGFGMENVKRRLKLLYPNKHDLDIQQKDGYYNVMLQLKMK